MKRVLTLVCALALVAGLNAQERTVKNVGAPVSAKKQLIESSAMMMPSKLATKAGETYDTMGSQVLYNQNGGYISLSWTGGVQSTSFGSVPAVYFTYGSGWASCYYGSGEIGYSFDFTQEGWYQGVLARPQIDQVLVGAYTLIGRVPSTQGDVNYRNMPLRFKAYTMGENKVSYQKSFDDIVTQGITPGIIETVYPVDPENYSAITDTVGVPLLPATEWILEYDRYGANFDKQVPVSENLCVSLLFPTDRTADDSLWNATTFQMTDGSNNSLVSDREAAMYVVYDFQYQDIFNPTENGERYDDFIPNEEDQPNKRYAIMAMSSWVWQNDMSHLDGEIPLFIVLGEATAVERGASYDRFVEVRNNPAIDYTVLQSADKIQKVELYNLSGKLVKTQACNENSVEVRLDGLSSGMYVAKVTTVAGVANKKIMVR